MGDFFWNAGPGRPAERLSLDVPLRRVREARLGESALRLPMLREAPGERDASVTLKRTGASLLAVSPVPGGRAAIRPRAPSPSFCR